MMNNHSSKSKAKLWVIDQSIKLDGAGHQELSIKNKFQMISLNLILVLFLRRIILILKIFIRIVIFL